MLTSEDKSWIRDTLEDVIENSPRINGIDNRLTTLEDEFSSFRLSIENEALPLLREVAAAYSGSDVLFHKRAEELDDMSREVDIHSQMIKSHELRLQALEIGKSKKMAKRQG